MNEKINLSYVLTTRNKLPYLKEVITRLLESLQPDEEVVITDGASSDGTVEFLTELYNQRRIHQFVSEPDCGEAHGYNKGILLAKGEIIKLISDDDVFCFPLIQDCKKYMLSNSSIDILAGNMAYLSLFSQSEIYAKIDDNNFIEYKKNKTPFWFNGQPLFIRKRSLSLLGLLNTEFLTVDTEFSLRITSNSKVKLSWLSNYISVRIDNENSNYNKFKEEIEIQAFRLFQFYNNSPKSKKGTNVNFFLFLFRKTLLYYLLSKISKKIKSIYPNRNEKQTHVTSEATDTIQPLFKQEYEKAVSWLNDKYSADKLNILI